MKGLKQKITINKASEKDFGSLIYLINALADYEKLERPDKKAQDRLKKDIFSPSPMINVWLAFDDSKAVGYAIFFYTYSSFLALPTLYLEDIFVLPEYRSCGIGKTLFTHCAKIALEEGCGRMEWMVLDWNKIGINFYKKIGAKQLKEWIPYRFTSNDLKNFLLNNK